jgi:hypothetical protein
VRVGLDVVKGVDGRLEMTPEQRYKMMVLEHLCTELHWMARRYADGRKTYAVEEVNNATDLMLSLDVDVAPCAEQKIYARDGDFGITDIREKVEEAYVNDKNYFKNRGQDQDL